MMPVHARRFRTTRWSIIVIVLLLAGPLACNGDCAGVGRPAFSIDVLDDVNGLPAAQGATVYVFRRPDMVLVDVVQGTENSQRIVAAWDQNGRFDVLLEKAGFWPWTQNNVLVETYSTCTTRTVNLTARLRLRTT